MNYRLDIIPAENGWIVNATFEGRVSITKVFNDQKELLVFIGRILPMLNDGYNQTLKAWIKK
jgi:hypothetical protein